MPVTSIAAVEDGARADRIREGGGKNDGRKKAEEPKKKGFGLGGLKQTVAPEKQTAQVSASGGSRGLGARPRGQGRQQPGDRQGRGPHRCRGRRVQEGAGLVSKSAGSGAVTLAERLGLGRKLRTAAGTGARG